MNQASLFLIVIAVTGFFTSRWMLRLAPLTSELALKTVGATALAALVGAGEGGLLPFVPSRTLLTVSLVLTPLFIFGPLALTGLARSQRYEIAGRLTDLLYWTSEGRSALKRLLVQVALQQGHPEAALTLLPHEEADQLMLAQAYALERKWDKVLALKVPEAGDNAFLALAARVQAYLALNRLDQAELEIAAMKERWERDQGPIGYRNIILSEARLAAERGQFERVREKLEQPPPGIAPWTVYAVAARAAERAGDLTTATKLYAQAYATAPAGRRSAFAEKLAEYDQPLPELAQVSRPYGTYGLLAATLIAYGAQAWLDARYGANTAFAAGAFVLNIGGVPQTDAPWRYLSYAFLHGGIVHLGFNAWVLFDIGRLFEGRRSWGNLLASFVLGSVTGAYLTVLFQGNDQLILVGASGGVLGIAGALLADAWRGRSTQDRALTRSLVQWMAIIVVFSLAIPNVSLWGHVGGVVGGLIWGFTRSTLPSSRALDRGVGFASLLLMGYALVSAANVLVRFLI